MITLVRTQSGEANAISKLVGPGAQELWLAGIFALFMLSFTGIPLTGGFIGKWACSAAAWRGGYDWLVIVAVLLSLVAAVFYLRIILVMFFGEPADGVVVGRQRLHLGADRSVGARGGGAGRLSGSGARSGDAGRHVHPLTP